MNDSQTRALLMVMRGDKSLAVLDQLPQGYTEMEQHWSWGQARIAKKSITEYMHHCPQCNGWIDGLPNERDENTIGVLSGRKGTAFHCRRCGYELSFFGMVA